jgi:predicted transcriptional regulator YdeE
MNYEVVYLKEKTVAGIIIRTSNIDPNMKKSIGETWQRFFVGGVYQSISSKENDNSIGLYTNYENKVNGAYDVMVCCEISKEEKLPTEINVKIIPEGKYAKFVTKGHIEKAVAECWAKIWATDLDRKYSFDFEEYVSGSEMDNAEINIYISIN